MGWLYLIVAGVLEIGWTLGLKYSKGFSVLIPSIITILLIIISFFMLSKAVKTLPIGTAYAVFTGIGTAGITVIGMLFLNESIDIIKILFVLLMLVGIIGLKIVSSDEKKLPSEADGKQ